MRRMTGGSTTSWSSTTVCATSSRSRPSPAVTSISELDPTKPNPAVNNYPGALVFAGDGEGREGKRSLIPGYYGAWAPRVSGAYSLNDKTTLRAGVGRSFGRVTVISGTSHFAGFIGQYEFFNTDSGVTPTFLLDRGLPAYPLPPQINPSFSNNTNVDYWNGKEAMLPATYDSWTVSMQRELRSADDPRSRLQRFEGLEPAGEPAESQPGAAFGGQGPHRAFRRRRRGVAAELPDYVGGCGRGRHHPALPELHQSGGADEPERRPVAAAIPAVRDDQYHQQRRRQDRAVDVPRRRAEADAAVVAGVHVPGQLHLLEADDRCRYFQRQHRLDGHRPAGARVLDRAFRPAPQHQAEHRVRVARSGRDGAG